MALIQEEGDERRTQRTCDETMSERTQDRR